MIQAGISIRHGTIEDIDRLVQLEAECFPAAEACHSDQMKQRLEVYPDHFWLLEINNLIVSFADGLVSSCADLLDEMYSDASMHQKQGRWLMLLGVDCDPSYRHHGYASQCLAAALKQAEKEYLSGIVLTCKKELIPFYEKNGYVNEGISSSVHGNVQWYQMRRVIASDTFETEHLMVGKAKTQR